MFAEEFYERVREHQAVHDVFREAQVVWHVQIGLPQRYMFTAMALIRGALERFCEKTADPRRTREALHRIVDLVMVESPSFFERIRLDPVGTQSGQLEAPAQAEQLSWREGRASRAAPTGLGHVVQVRFRHHQIRYSLVLGSRIVNVDPFPSSLVAVSVPP